MQEKLQVGDEMRIQSSFETDFFTTLFTEVRVDRNTNSKRNMKVIRRHRSKRVECCFMLTKPWAFIILLLALTHPRPHSYAKVGVAEAKKSIPHSKETYLYSTSPAWNHSPQIDKHGFLTTRYKMYPGTWEKDARIGGKYGYKSMHTRYLDRLDVVIRQVPGDGNCLFHSLSTALSWVEDRAHLDFDESFRGKKKNSKNSRKSRNGRTRTRTSTQEELDLFTRSTILRQLSVDVLNPKPIESDSSTETKRLGLLKRNGRNKLKPLFLQGSEFLRHEELLDVACSQYGLTGGEYCESMRNNGVWGGGPEIVALCNYLKRPIHVYELMTVRPEIGSTRSGRGHKKSQEDEESNPEFRLRRMALFGSPKFDYREPLHILSADCRFPDIKPGQQASAGNHFMAMFIQKGGTRTRIGQRSARAGACRQGVRVRSGSRDRNNRWGENTFARREVISKYLRSNDSTCSGDEITTQGFMDRIMKRMLADDHNKKAEVDDNANDNPIQAIVKWCNDRRMIIGDDNKIDDSTSDNPVQAIMKWCNDRRSPFRFVGRE